ncbi:MAG: sodium:alanine symporter family protein [Synergistes sp.]|nr:sodium:alanine symporter family protein [Synergistes sp.]MCR5335192.1 sodium:alanine symporter family protein [Synergistes sp.]
MDWFWKLNGVVNGIVWGPWMLAFLVGTGVWLTFVLRFPQVRYFGMMFTEVLGNVRKKSSSAGTISSFAAMATALAATVGTGNIAGVATALHLGGPGALVWMMISAIFGMTTKFSEVTLAVRYREECADGSHRGGTMYILEKALGMKWLAVIFAIFTVFASFGIGNMVQSNSTAEGIAMGFGVPPHITGIIIAIVVGLVIWGGLKRIATVTVYLVPFMAIFYIIGAIGIIIMHAGAIPSAIAYAFRGAFCDPMALPGAIAGWSVKAAITRGIARGVFSNEAGLGSAPMVHCAARTDHPVRQGLYGLFEVFMDTIVICNLTALTILVTGVLTNQPELTGAKLSLAAFSSVLGQGGVMVLSLALSLFALSTILGWYWYAETAIVYLTGGTALITPFKILWMVLIVLGAWGSGTYLANLWDLSDTLNGLMAVPNLIGLLLLTKELRRLVADFDQKLKDGTLKR